MKKIYTIIVLLGAIVLGSCSDFLQRLHIPHGPALWADRKYRSLFVF